MNKDDFPTITIDLVLDRLTTKDVLTAMLHSILFHRLLGTIKPKDLEVLNVTMPGVADAIVESQVTKIVDSFWRRIENGTIKRGQISLTLFEKKEVRSWFGTREEEIPWERWIVNAEVRQPRTDADRQTFISTLESNLTKSLHTMLTHTSSPEGRKIVPLMQQQKKPSVSPFTYKITVTIGGSSEEVVRFDPGTIV